MSPTPNPTDTAAIGEAPTAPNLEPVDPILRYFAFEHLPAKLQIVSRPFCVLAREITDPGSVYFLPRNAERSVALRKLLEAKDAAVRAAVPPPTPK